MRTTSQVHALRDRSKTVSSDAVASAIWDDVIEKATKDSEDRTIAKVTEANPGLPTMPREWLLQIATSREPIVIENISEIQRRVFQAMIWNTKLNEDSDG